MDRFLTRGSELILPGCGGTWALALGATLAARWLYEPQSQSAIGNHPVGLGFPHPARGGIDRGDLPLHPWVVGVVEIWKRV